MDPRLLHTLFQEVKDGTVNIEDAMKRLKNLPCENLDFVNIDHHRALRRGFPEVVYCEGKKACHVTAIMQKLSESNENIIGTRASKEQFEDVKSLLDDAVFHEDARMIVLRRSTEIFGDGTIAVVTGGTADIPVAEEAAVTAEVMGNEVLRIFDVGVAGIHRLFARIQEIKNARVVIAVAGMEGALASVVAGMIDRPVIAVPTSVGYGANFGGVSALLTMLNSCAGGIGVVNIDNGFGAGQLASIINRRPV